jgi:hypothetical protein
MFKPWQAWAAFVGNHSKAAIRDGAVIVGNLLKTAIRDGAVCQGPTVNFFLFLGLFVVLIEPFDRNTKELYRHETCCWNHPLANEPRAPCSCAFVLPAGSMAGFVLTVYGYSQFLYFNDIVYEQLLAVGINLTTVIGVDINQFLQEQVYPIPMVTGILIMLFGTSFFVERG